MEFSVLFLYFVHWWRLRCYSSRCVICRWSRSFFFDDILFLNNFFISLYLMIFECLFTSTRVQLSWWQVLVLHLLRSTWQRLSYPCASWCCHGDSQLRLACRTLLVILFVGRKTVQRSKNCARRRPYLHDGKRDDAPKILIFIFSTESVNRAWIMMLRMQIERQV